MNQRQLELERDLYRLLLDAEEKCSDIDTIMSTAIKLVVAITGARLGYMEIHDCNGKSWQSMEHCSENDAVSIRKRISTGIISEALSTGETIITPSAFLDSRFSERDSVREDRIEAVLCSPFERDGVSGVIYLQGEGENVFENEQCLLEIEFFTKHISPLLKQINNILRLSRESVSLRTKYDLSDIIGDSKILAGKLREAMSIAEIDVMVLLTGETGTGKGALAKAIHKNSPRKYKPFVHVNCANLPEQLAESELFGAARGAHSGAYADIKGKIASAKGGTLFLDEIGTLPLPVQSKLLQFLEEGTYCPLGSAIPLDADVRIIAASNIDFSEAIKNGTFKEDLYYRLCVFPIEIPPLRCRRDDIATLVKYFNQKYCHSYRMNVLEIDSPIILALEECEWKGNVRELENRMQQAILRARAENSDKLFFHHLLPEKNDIIVLGETITYRQGKDSWERNFLNLHLNKNAWNISETARILDLSRSHLNNLIRMHQLERTGGEPVTD